MVGVEILRNGLHTYFFHLIEWKYWVFDAIKPFDHAKNTLGDTAPQTVAVLRLETAVMSVPGQIQRTASYEPKIHNAPPQLVEYIFH